MFFNVVQRSVIYCNGIEFSMIYHIVYCHILHAVQYSIMYYNMVKCSVINCNVLKCGVMYCTETEFIVLYHI